MDKYSQQLYQDALKAGKEKVYNIRLMIVGHLGVGKTTLTKRILAEKVVEAPHDPTKGIEVHSRRCKIDLHTHEWVVEEKEHRFPDNAQPLVNIVSRYAASKNKNSREDVRQEKKTNIQNPFTNTEEQDQKDDIRQDEDLVDFVRNYRTMTHLDKIFCYVTVLDFAGQFVFYTTHQTFMSWRTIYLLVTDMSKSLDDLVKGDTCSLDLNTNMESSIKDYALFWLNSIYSHGIPTDTSEQCEWTPQRETDIGAAKYPPVILVATHSDKVPKGEEDETKEEYFDAVRKILKERPQRFLLKGYCAFSNFGIDAADANIDKLKDKILKLAQTQDYWGEELPGRWLALEENLMKSKRSGRKIIKYSNVEEINNRSAVKIENPDELEVFLRFEHDIGNIVFFNTAKLRDKVVLDPEWLIDGVTILISKPNQLIEDPEIYPQWYDFKETGRLTKALIGRLWSGSEHEENRDHLLDLMEQLSMIAKPVEKDGSEEDHEQYYWVPSVISKSAPDHVKNPKPCEGMTRSSTLCFVSTTKFIHVGVFHRLVASFLSKWTPARELEDGEYQLYSGCCQFQVDKRHNLLLVLNDYVILATMFRYSSRGEYPDNKLCSEVRSLISSTQSDITGCICPNVKFDICVKCNKSSTGTIKGLHAISAREEKTCMCSSPCHAVNVEALMTNWEVDTRQSRLETDIPLFVQIPVDSQGDTQGELHRVVLSRCLPVLLNDLDFNAVMNYIQANELFDDLTVRDISEQTTTSDKIREVIKRIKQRDHATYEKFKQCLDQANQASIKALLEKEEEAIANKTRRT